MTRKSRRRKTSKKKSACEGRGVEYRSVLHLICNLIKEDVQVGCLPRVNGHLSTVEECISIPARKESYAKRCRWHTILISFFKILCPKKKNERQKGVTQPQRAVGTQPGVPTAALNQQAADKRNGAEASRRCHRVDSKHCSPLSLYINRRPIVLCVCSTALFGERWVVAWWPVLPPTFAMCAGLSRSKLATRMRSSRPAHRTAGGAALCWAWCRCCAPTDTHLYSLTLPQEQHTERIASTHAHEINSPVDPNLFSPLRPIVIGQAMERCSLPRRPAWASVRVVRH